MDSVMDYGNIKLYDNLIKQFITSLNAIQDDRISSQEQLVAFLQSYVGKLSVKSADTDYLTAYSDPSVSSTAYVKANVKKVVDASAGGKGLATIEDLYSLLTSKVGLDSSLSITWTNPKYTAGASIVSVLNDLQTDFGVVKPNETTYSQITSMLNLGTYPICIEPTSNKEFLYYGKYTETAGQPECYYFIAFNDTEFKMWVCHSDSTWTTKSVYYATQETITAINNEIKKLSRLSRYLSLWDCSTGYPQSEPETTPYTYITGDYYIVGKVNGTSNNYIPDGSVFIKDQHSTTLATTEINVGDKFYYDGAVWTYMSVKEQLIPIDTSLDSESPNPVQNKAIHSTINEHELILVTAIQERALDSSLRVTNSSVNALENDSEKIANKIDEFDSSVVYTSTQYPSAHAVQKAVTDVERVVTTAIISLNEQVSDISTEIQSINSSIEEKSYVIVQSLNTINSSIAGLRTYVDGSINTINSSIAGLKTYVDGSINTINSSIAGLKTYVDSSFVLQSDFEEASALTALTLQTFNSSIHILDTKITNSDASIANVSNRLYNVSLGVDNANSSITNVSSRLYNVSLGVDALDSSVAANYEKLSNKVDEFDVSVTYTTTQYPSAHAVQKAISDFEFVFVTTTFNTSNKISDISSNLYAANSSISDISTRLYNASTKLDTIETNAQVNVLEGLKINGTAQTIESKYVNLITTDSASADSSSFATKGYVDVSMGDLLSRITALETQVAQLSAALTLQNSN